MCGLAAGARADQVLPFTRCGANVCIERKLPDSKRPKAGRSRPKQFNPETRYCADAEMINFASSLDRPPLPLRSNQRRDLTVSCVRIKRRGGISWRHNVNTLCDKATWRRYWVGWFGGSLANGSAAARYSVIQLKTSRLVEHPLGTFHGLVRGALHPNLPAPHRSSSPCTIGQTNDDDTVFFIREMPSLAVKHNHRWSLGHRFANCRTQGPMVFNRRSRLPR